MTQVTPPAPRLETTCATIGSAEVSPMLGRLIIVVLVVCSAFAVAWHQKRTDAATLDAAVAETKATDADQRTAAAEKRAHDAEARALQAEAKASFFEGELAKTSAAAEDPVNAARALHITGAVAKGVSAERAGKDDGVVALALAGDPGEIARIRVFACDAEGAPVWREAWDTSDKGGTWGLDVLHGGQVVVEQHAPSVMQTRPGATMLELRLAHSGARLVPGMLYAVEVTVDGKTMTRVLKR